MIVAWTGRPPDLFRDPLAARKAVESAAARDVLVVVVDEAITHASNEIVLEAAPGAETAKGRGR